MKKILITLALVMSLSMIGCAATQGGGGLFQRGENVEETKGGPGLPGHGQEGNQPAPVGGGIAILATLGGAYLIGKRNNKED